REIAFENKQLRAAMKDILQAMKQTQQTTQQGVLKIPSLENLIQSMESKRNIGVESTTHSRAQLEQMTGRNDELRNELRHLRAEHAAVTNEKSELLKQVGYLQSEVDAIAQSSVSRLTSVPRHISAQSKIDGNSNDIITGLNEQLIQTLEELAKKDSMISDLKQSLESSKRKLNAIRHQTHLLYKDYSERESKFENERKSMEDERNKWREKDERDSVKLDEYQRLLDALKSDPEEMKSKLAETSRKVSLLRANEKSLIRRNKALEVTEAILTEDRNKLRNESFLIEKEVSERIGYLERHKEMSVFKLASLQNALEGTVPESELKMSNRKFDDLTKYRDLLQKENQFVVDNVKFAGLQVSEELKIASESLLATKQDLTIEKEKRHHLEESFEKLGNKELLSSDVEVSSAIQKVTILEMKELNERQRADHATRMYNKLKSSLQDLENRNLELDQKFNEV
uniref:Centrosomal protein of 290kDa coiled-coil region domain-containing protein n=1 Tax=Ciona savignyi TaxID=51511 RepID=H2YZT8_CIOSA